MSLIIIFIHRINGGVGGHIRKPSAKPRPLAERVLNFILKSQEPCRYHHILTKPSSHPT